MQLLKRSLNVFSVVLVSAGLACAEDLTWNAQSTTNLTGDFSCGNVDIGNAGTPNANTIVDATGTTSFTANGTRFYVGGGPNNLTATGTLRLGPTNNITVTNQVTIGGLQPDQNIANGHAGLVTTLTNSIITINTANMAVGTGKAGGTQITGYTGGNFVLNTNATLNLYGYTGSGSRAILIVGRYAGDNAPRGRGTLDLSRGIANLYLSELGLGKVTAGNGLDSTTPTAGTLLISTDASNHLDVSGAGTVVRIGYCGSTGGNTTTAGTLTIGNLDSTSSITSTDNSTAIIIGWRTNSTSACTGIMNLNGGTLEITTTGTAILGGAFTGAVASLNLKDCTLKAGASSTNWITGLTSARLTNSVAFNTAGYDIAVPQGFSSTGSLVKDGAGTMTLTGVNTYTGGTTVSNGTLLVNGSVTGSVTVVSGASLGGTGHAGGNVILQSGAKAVLTPDSPLTIPGSITLNNNVIHLRLPEGLEIGVYTLLIYNTAGSSGSFATALVVDTGSANGLLGLVQSAGQVDLKVFAGGTVYRFR